MMAQYDWVGQEVNSGYEPFGQPNTYKERKEKNPKYMYFSTAWKQTFIWMFLWLLKKSENKE